MSENENGPLASVIMGSRSDLPTMRHAAEVLRELGVPHEVRIVSAHRTPELMSEFAKSAKDRGVKVIIAGAGGAAHLPGMVAANTILPVIGVPVESSALSGLDFFVIDCPNAARGASGDSGDRAVRRGQCGFAGSTDYRCARCGSSGAVGAAPRGRHCRGYGGDVCE